MWHSGLPDRWDDVQPIPPLPEPVDLESGVDGESMPSGYVIRDGKDYVCALDEDVVDLEAAR